MHIGFWNIIGTEGSRSITILLTFDFTFFLGWPIHPKLKPVVQTPAVRTQVVQPPVQPLHNVRWSSSNMSPFRIIKSSLQRRWDPPKKFGCALPERRVRNSDKRRSERRCLKHFPNIKCCKSVKSTDMTHERLSPNRIMYVCRKTVRRSKYRNKRRRPEISVYSSD